MSPKSLKSLRKLTTFLRKGPYRVDLERGARAALRPKGEAVIYFSGRPSIGMTYNRYRRQPAVETGLLIHEYGHHAADKLLGAEKATEADAWAVGKRLVPPHLVPRQYEQVAKRMINTYACDKTVAGTLATRP